MKKFLALVLAVMMLATLAGCGKKEAEKEEAPTTGTEQPKQEESTGAEFTGEFKIGAFSSLLDLDGEMITKAVDLYAKNTNAAGGLMGAKVVPVYYNNPEGTTENAIKITQTLINNDKVNVAIPSQLSGCILACGEMYNDAQILTLGLGLSPTWMEQGWDYVYRPTYNTNFTAPQYAATIKKLGMDTVAVFEGQTDYGKSTGETFRAACEAEGVTVTTTEKYVPNQDTEFSGQIGKILGTNPDCVFLACDGGDSGNVAKQFRQNGYTGLFFYSEALRADMIEMAEGATNGTVLVSPYVAYTSVEECNDEFMKEFLTMWEAEYGEVPGSTMAYKAWDACLTIDAAVKAAGSLDPEAINEALKTCKFRALGGNFDFTTGSNECLYDFFGWVYTDGEKFEMLDTWMQSDAAKAYLPQ